MHFAVDPTAASDTVLLYTREYRDVWYMRKTTPPMVPAIAASDLPDRQPNQEEKKKFLRSTCDRGCWIARTLPSRCRT